MQITLDECFPRRLRHLLTGHTVTTVPEPGWASRRNGELLQLAAGRFEVFMTIDRGIAFQQHLANRPFVTVLLTARSN